MHQQWLRSTAQHLQVSSAQILKCLQFILTPTELMIQFPQIRLFPFLQFSWNIHSHSLQIFHKHCEKRNNKLQANKASVSLHEGGFAWIKNKNHKVKKKKKSEVMSTCTMQAFSQVLYFMMVKSQPTQVIYLHMNVEIKPWSFTGHTDDGDKSQQLWWTQLTSLQHSCFSQWTQWLSFCNILAYDMLTPSGSKSGSTPAPFI